MGKRDTYTIYCVFFVIFLKTAQYIDFLALFVII